MSVVQNKKYRDRQKRKDAVISLFIGIFAFIWLVVIAYEYTENNVVLIYLCPMTNFGFSIQLEVLRF